MKLFERSPKLAATVDELRDNLAKKNAAISSFRSAIAARDDDSLGTPDERKQLGDLERDAEILRARVERAVVALADELENERRGAEHQAWANARNKGDEVVALSRALDMAVAEACRLALKLRDADREFVNSLPAVAPGFPRFEVTKRIATIMENALIAAEVIPPRGILNAYELREKHAGEFAAQAREYTAIAMKAAPPRNPGMRTVLAKEVA